MQLYIEIILLPVRKKLYLVKNDQELYVSSRYRVSGVEHIRELKTLRTFAGYVMNAIQHSNTEMDLMP